MAITVQATPGTQQVVMLTIDATTSIDPDGQIVHYLVNIGGTVAPPPNDPLTGAPTGLVGPTITGGINYEFPAPQAPVLTHVYSGPSPIPVTVVATDETAMIGYLTQQVPFDLATLTVEPLVAAEQGDGAASTDGEKTWQVAIPPSATVCAPIALNGRIIFGDAAGQLWASDDYLATDPLPLNPYNGGPFPAAVTCLWNNEGLGAATLKPRWIAGLANGRVFLSTTNGDTWTEPSQAIAPAVPYPWGTATINDISESPFAANQATAAVGNNLWRTFDLREWKTLIEHNATCLRFAAGFFGTSKTYAGFSNGVIKRWSDIPNTPGTVEVIAPTPTNQAVQGAIKGLTLAVEEEALYVFTDYQGAGGYETWTWRPTPGATGPAGTLTPGAPAPTAVNYAIRSGEGPVVYLATDGAIGKWLPKGGYYDIRPLSGSLRGLRVGYGSQAPTAAPQQMAAVWNYDVGHKELAASETEVLLSNWANKEATHDENVMVVLFCATGKTGLPVAASLGSTAPWGAWQTTSHARGNTRLTISQQFDVPSRSADTTLRVAPGLNAVGGGITSWCVLVGRGGTPTLKVMAGISVKLSEVNSNILSMPSGTGYYPPSSQVWFAHGSSSFPMPSSPAWTVSRHVPGLLGGWSTARPLTSHEFPKSGPTQTVASNPVTGVPLLGAGIFVDFVLTPR